MDCHFVTGSQPSPEIMDWYVIEIARMRSSHVVKFLLSYLKSKKHWQRVIAIRALAQLGDIRTKLQGKDCIE